MDHTSYGPRRLDSQLDGTDIDGGNLVTNPSDSAVYRWFTEEHSTILVDGIFQPVAGRQALIVK